MMNVRCRSGAPAHRRSGAANEVVTGGDPPPQWNTEDYCRCVPVTGFGLLTTGVCDLGSNGLQSTSCRS